MKALLSVAAVLSLSCAHVSQANDYWLVKEKSIDAASLERINIDVVAGDISIVGVDDLDTVQLTARFGGDEIESSDFSLVVDSRRSAGMIETRIDSGWNNNTFIDLEIKVPSRLHVTLEDRSGDIEIIGMNGDVEVSDRSGDIEINRLGGDLTIDDRSGDINIRNISGSLSVDDNSGDIVIVNARGSVGVDDSSGDINIRNVDGDVSIEDSSGDIEISQVEGRVEVNDSSGDVDVDGASDFTIDKSGSGDIESNNINRNRRK